MTKRKKGNETAKPKSSKRALKDLKPKNPQKVKGGWAALAAFGGGVKAPRDISTGTASGKRQY